MRKLMLLAFAACTSGSNDVVGPFTGPVSRFAVDSITLPTSSVMAYQLGDDLDGDGRIDNTLGQMFGMLSLQADLSTHGADMIASGAIASSLELQAPDLTTATAGATYYGADNADATVAGGEIVDGAFTSNRTRTTHVPGQAVVYLAVLADADPSIVEIDHMELDLTPDGRGGYDALVRGAVRPDDVFAVLCDGMIQMIAADPTDHYLLAGMFDSQRRGSITCSEIENNSLFQSFLAPDVTLENELFDSIGFVVHLVPCDAGACAMHQPADACHDRVQDNGETGVDCGGACRPCPVAQPSCSDGIRDGLETDVDCGWNCTKCMLGQQCWNGLDCASGKCDGDRMLGKCVP
jgi:hypothetical protein